MLAWYFLSRTGNNHEKSQSNCYIDVPIRLIIIIIIIIIMVYWSEFLATDPEVPGSIASATRFSE
jgi:hypothetical protein